jgi:hypothetical protein
MTDDTRSGQLPVPGLADRARLFLRAVQGERDFTRSEHAHAEDVILQAMAADIAFRSDRDGNEEPWADPLDARTKAGSVVAPAAMSVRLEDYESRLPETDEALSSFPSALEDRQVPQSPSGNTRYETQARLAPMARAAHYEPRPSATIAAAHRARRGRESGPSPSSIVPKRKSLKRRVVWGTALSISAGLCVLVGLTLYPNQNVTRSNLRTAQSEPMFEATAPIAPQLNRVGSSDIANPVVSPPVAAESRALGATSPVYGVVPAAPKVELSRSGFVEQARAVIASGNIEAARAALSKKVDSGSASSAVVIGATYDPNMLDALGGQNIAPDIAKARLWYRRAQQMGAPEATSLLEKLESVARRSR